MSDAYIGEIRMFAGTFAPYGWVLCQGQALSTSTYSPLFQLLGYTYGGSGSSFCVPDLRGRIPMNAGTSPSLGETHARGEGAGSESVALTSSNLPSHTHSFQASDSGGATSPTGNFPAGTAGLKQYAAPAAANASMSSAAVGALAGGTAAHENRPPVLAVNFIICTTGNYPAQS
jgi:microcystin-dependent protein